MTDVYYLDKRIEAAHRFDAAFKDFTVHASGFRMAERWNDYRAAVARGETPSATPKHPDTRLRPGGNRFEWERARESIVRSLAMAETGQEVESILTYAHERYHQDAQLAES